MAFELTEDFVKEHGLSPEQATAITSHGTTVSDTITADLKKEYDETYKNTANTNADNIINGAITATWKATGFELERNQGEKNAEYMLRYNAELLKDKTAKLDGSILEYEGKLKDFDGDAGTKQKLTDTLESLEALKLKTANYDDIVGYQEKYNTLSSEHLTMKEKVCYGGVKPNFPDTIDEFRVDAKWKEFMERTNKEYTVELVDGVETAISKENEHRTLKLSDLVKADEELNKMLEGRQQQGTGAKGTGKNNNIEGIPFSIPEGLTSPELHKFLESEIAKTIPNIASKDFSDKFGEYWNKIRGQKTA
jgi:hypothetical protein